VKTKTMRRAYLMEAIVVLTVARLVLRLLPSAWVFAWAGRPPGRIQRFRGDEIEWVSWAVEKVGASSWMEVLCSPRALATQSMLRRRGIAIRLCLGVGRQNDALIARAWIEIAHKMIVAGTEARGFTNIAEFGRETA
jgi:hypothetical protein